MPSPTFNNHLVSFSYSQAAGLTVAPGGGDPPITLSPEELVCVLPAPDAPPHYILLHQMLAAPELVRTPIICPPKALLDRLLLASLPPHLSPKHADITVLVSTRSGIDGTAAAFFDAIFSPLLLALGLTPVEEREGRENEEEAKEGANETEEAEEAKGEEEGKGKGKGKGKDEEEKEGVRVIRTSSAACVTETVTALSQRTTRGRAQTVILLGGDTTVHEAVNAPRAGAPTDVALAVFPLGSGNALASSYHSARAIPPLYALLFGAPRPLPLFTATFSPGARWAVGSAGGAGGGGGDEVAGGQVRGAVVASWGFHASLVADAESLRMPGRGGEQVQGAERFQVAARENLQPPLHVYRGVVRYLREGQWHKLSPPPPPPQQQQQQQQQQQHDSEHFYVLVTLCSHLEETFAISPASVPGSLHAMRLVHFGVPPSSEAGEEVMGIMAAAYRGGKHVDDPRVGYREVEGVQIEIRETDERWRRVCIDGRIAVLPEGGSVQVTMGGGDGGGLRLIWAE